MYLPSSFVGKYWMASFCVVLCQCVMSSQLSIEIIGVTMTNFASQNSNFQCVHACAYTHTRTHTLYQDVGITEQALIQE